MKNLLSFQTHVKDKQLDKRSAGPTDRHWSRRIEGGVRNSLTNMWIIKLKSIHIEEISDKYIQRVINVKFCRHIYHFLRIKSIDG